MMKKTLPNFYVLLLLMLMSSTAFAQLSGSYTINPDGTGATNYTSISSAVAALNARGVSSSVTFTLAPGLYVEQIVLKPIKGASSTNRITFDGVHPDSVTIQSDFATNLSTSYVIQFDGADFITLSNLNIEKTKGSYRSSLHFTNGADSNEVSNCILNVNGNEINYRNVIFADASSISVTGSHGNYNSFSNCQILGGYYGVQLLGSSKAQNIGNSFSECNWVDVFYYGVYDSYGVSTNIKNCDINIKHNFGYVVYTSNTKDINISNSSLTNGNYGVYANNTQNLGLDSLTITDSRNNIYVSNSQKISISNSELANSDNYGVYSYHNDNLKLSNNTIIGNSNSYYNLYIDHSNNLGSDSIIANYFLNAQFNNIYASNSNNSFWVNNTLGGGLPDNSYNEGNINLYQCNNNVFYHNTLYFKGGGTTVPNTTAYAFYAPSNLMLYYSEGLDVQNNIFVYEGNNSNGTNIANFQGSFLASDFNAFESSKILYNVNTTQYKTLVDWSKVEKSLNLNSVQQTIYFVDRSNADFHLDPNYVGVEGAKLGINYDIDSDSRCEFSQTVGSDESNFAVAKPIVDFTAPDTVFINNPTKFKNINGGLVGQKHEWTIDGKVVSTDLNLDYTWKYIGTGTATIQLKTTNCGGVDSLSKTVYVILSSVKPLANFVISKRTVEVFETINLSDISSNNPTSWTWIISPDSIFDPLFLATVPRYTFTNGTNINSKNAVLTLDYPGTYTISLIVANSKGADTLIKKDAITVKTIRNMCIFPEHTDIASGTLYDDGGPTGQYSSNGGICDFLINTCASEVTFRLGAFDVAAGDYLRIYDGKDNTGTPLWNTSVFGANGITGKLGTPGLNPIFVANSGVMFIEFETNTTGTADGFTGYWSTKPGTFTAPKAMFTSVDSVCVGHPIDFQSNATGDINEHRWNFGVNAFSTATDEDPSYIYYSPGTYRVSYAVEGCAGTDSIYKNVYAFTQTKAPKGDFTANITRPTLNDVVTFTPEVENCVDNYEWTISPNTFTYVNGTSDKSERPQVIFRSPGKYDITARIINASSSVNIQKKDYIEIIDYCTPSVAYLSEDLGISGVQLNGTPNLDATSSAGRFGYNNFTNVVGASTRIEHGAKYTVTVIRPTANNKIRRGIWIDWNQDGTFSSSEEIGKETSGSPSKTYSVSFTVPISAKVGGTRMRVGTTIGTKELDPCGPNIYGEFEDYRVIVAPDVTLPIVSLKGADTVYVEQCETYVDSGAVACDNIGGCVYPVTMTGSVNTSVVDTFVLSYNSTDSAGNNSLTTNRYVIVNPDLIKPEVALVGKDSIVLKVFDTYVEEGVTATDYCGVANTFIKSNLNTSVVGDAYQIAYNTIDNNGNSTTIFRYVSIIDDESPVISLIGNDTVQVPLNGTYTDLGVTVTDNYYSDTDVFVNSQLNLNTKQTGFYLQTYTAIDPSNNKSTDLIRYVEVIDDIAPVVTINGADTIYMNVNTRLFDPMAKAVDNYDTQLGNLSLTGEFYTKFPNGIAREIGTFEAEYAFYDKAGNKGTASRFIVVEDLVAPTLELKDDYTMTICKWEEYIEPGYIATDNYDKESDIQVTVSGEVNNNVEGVYYLTYTAKDASGNVSLEETRVVTVKKCYSNVDEGLASFVNVFPNPTRNYFTIRISLPSVKTVDITILNSLGQTIKTVENGSILNANYNVDLSNQSSGVYFVKIQTKDETIMQRISLNK